MIDRCVILSHAAMAVAASFVPFQRLPSIRVIVSLSVTVVSEFSIICLFQC